MKFKDLKQKYENEVLNEIEFEKIEEHEEVIAVENNGNSGRFPNLTWYTIYSEEDEFDIYF